MKLSATQLLEAELSDSDATQLWNLQRSAYAVEARIIQDARIPQLHESLAQMRAAGLSWWVVRLDENEIVGALGFRASDGVLDIERLVVDADVHRRGVATALVLNALSAAHRVTVSTGAKNTPARGLYEQLGFDHLGDREVLSGLWVSDYCASGTSLA